MFEFRGPAALIALGISGVIVVGFGGLTMWWLSRKPETAPVILPLRRRFLASFILAFASMIGVLLMGLIWALSE